MLVYFDSSALVKRYAPNEPNAALVTRKLTTTNRIYTCSITPVGVRSAFRNKERSQEFTPAEVTAGVQDYEAHSRKQYTLIQLTTSMVTIANQLVLKHKLRAYDALHIATATEIVQLSISNLIYTVLLV